MADDYTLHRDFFISRADSDKDIARVIAQILRAAGFTTWLEDEDFGSAIFMARMAQGWSLSERVICLLSSNYQKSEHCKREYEVLLASDPHNLKERVIALRVEDCTPIEHLTDLAYVDLLPVLHDAEALARVVRGAVAPARDRREADLAARHRRLPQRIVHREVHTVPGFAGRQAELDAIDRALWAKSGGMVSRINAPAAVATVNGLGGVGKSALAREYAWSNRARYQGVWWVRAERRETLLDDLIELGARFIAGLREAPERDEAARLVLKWLEQSGVEKPWLLVYDGVEEPDGIKTLTPRTGVHVIVTTRWSNWGARAVSVKVGVFPPDVATQFLLDATGRTDHAGTESLAGTLGHLPLALDHAAAYCRRSEMDFADYEKLASELLLNAPKDVDYERPVFATFSLALAKAAETCPAAEKLMALCAFLAPDRIPLDLFDNKVFSEIELGEAVGALAEVSLVKRDDRSNEVSVHRQVQMVMLGRLAQMKEYQKAAALGADLVAVLFEKENRLAEAEPLVRRLLAEQERVNGPQHPSVAVTLWCLAQVLWRGNQLVEAERLLLRAVTIGEASLSSDDSLVGVFFESLAQLMQDTGRLAAAEPLMRRAIAAFEMALGANHPHVAYALNKVALLLQSTNRLGEAETLMRRALAIHENSVGPEHPDVGRDLHYLGQLLHDANRLTEAEPLMRRALSIAERNFGPHHPGVATALNNLASLLHLAGRPAEAEPMMWRALAIQEAGADLPGLATALDDLAGLLERTNRLTEAEPLRRRAVEIVEKAFGAQHPNVATALNNHARLLGLTGQLTQAEPLMRRALAIDERTLGSNHPKFARDLDMLATLLSQTNRLAEALRIYRHAVAISENVYGSNHPDVARQHANIYFLEVELRQRAGDTSLNPDGAQPRVAPRREEEAKPTLWSRLFGRR
jgi:tetratricopeptide (TPR) repeat protein